MKIQITWWKRCNVLPEACSSSDDSDYEINDLGDDWGVTYRASSVRMALMISKAIMLNVFFLGEAPTPHSVVVRRQFIDDGEGSRIVHQFNEFLQQIDLTSDDESLAEKGWMRYFGDGKYARIPLRGKYFPPRSAFRTHTRVSTMSM